MKLFSVKGFWHIVALSFYVLILYHFCSKVNNYVISM